MVLNEETSKVVNHIDTAYWELKKNQIFWSSAFIDSLGFSKDELKFKLEFFIESLIHIDDSKQFRNNFFSFIKSNTNFRQSILIKSKKGRYIEYVCKTNYIPSQGLNDESKFIYFYKRKIKTNENVKSYKFYHKETAEMTKTGSWHIDFSKKRIYWDQQTRRILEYPEDYIPSLKHSEDYIAKDYVSLAAHLFMQCAQKGKSFNKEIKMLTTSKRAFWVQTMGKPIFNDNKEIIGIRGVFQDIDAKKTKELDLLRTSNIISSQNERLFNFAHIVSHNLRSHTSNLTLITELINTSETVEEKLDLMSNIESITNSLNETIEHLNEVVTIQTTTNNSKTLISFTDTVQQVRSTISQIIINEKAQIITDFSKLERILYIPAYLESIILNLITNAIKYKHPDRNPIINIKTYLEHSKPVLEITDNGIGIDLETFGNKIFGMYNTFHRNKDAVGIGLFITKNQIEALHGEISVKSEVNKGTTFTIKF